MMLGTDIKAAVTAAFLTLAATVTYSVTAGAPFGTVGIAAMIMSGVVASSVGAFVAGLTTAGAGQLFSPRASVAILIATGAIRWGATQASTPQAFVHAVGMLTLCLFVAMLIQLAFACLQLGRTIRMIPLSVSDGLVVALAIKLGVSQIAWLFAPQARDAAIATILIGACSMVALAVARRRGQKALAPLISLLVGTLVAITIECFFPSTKIPALEAVDMTQAPLLSISSGIRTLLGVTANKWIELVTFGGAIALVNSMETLSAVLRLEEYRRERIDPNRALLASAVGSLSSLCVGGLPVAGTTTTSVILMRAGAANRRAAIATAAFVFIGAAAGGRFLGAVPLSAVATLMFSVGLDLALSPVKNLVRRLRIRSHGALGELGIVFLVVVTLLLGGVVSAVIAGLVAATCLAFRAMRLQLVAREYDAPEDARVRIMEVRQPLIFATVESIIGAMEAVPRRTHAIVLDLGFAGTLDSSAARTLATYADRLRDRLSLLIVGNSAVVALAPELQDCRVCNDLSHAIEAAIWHVRAQEHDIPPKADISEKESDSAGSAVSSSSIGLTTIDRSCRLQAHYKHRSKVGGTTEDEIARILRRRKKDLPRGA